MRELWKWDGDANVWRFMAVSRIQNNALRRALLVVTLPFMLLWWVVMLFVPTIGFAITAVLYLALIPVFPIWHFFRSFPIETFRSFARRWKEPALKETP